jgi:alpha-tubulin suppressor-like RCC1 family protein
VSAGDQDTCAIQVMHTMWCWGTNQDGQLGNGTTTASDIPIQAGTRANWAQVSVGYLHACAIQIDQSLWCWARLTEWGPGQTSPVQIGTAAGWAEASAGTATCALLGDPGLWCFGSNASGELGIGTTGGFYGSPLRVGNEGYWTQVSDGTEGSACAIRRDDSLWCWGDNTYGELGIGSTGGLENAPAQVS